MKNKVKFLGIIVLAAVIVFSMTACGEAAAVRITNDSVFISDDTFGTLEFFRELSPRRDVFELVYDDGVNDYYYYGEYTVSGNTLTLINEAEGYLGDTNSFYFYMFDSDTFLSNSDILGTQFWYKDKE